MLPADQCFGAPKFRRVAADVVLRLEEYLKVFVRDRRVDVFYKPLMVDRLLMQFFTVICDRGRIIAADTVTGDLRAVETRLRLSLGIRILVNAGTKPDLRGLRLPAQPFLKFGYERCIILNMLTIHIERIRLGPAGDHGMPAQHVLQRFGNEEQCGIAGAPAVHFIDQMEMVDIKHQRVGRLHPMVFDLANVFEEIVAGIKPRDRIFFGRVDQGCILGHADDPLATRQDDLRHVVRLRDKVRGADPDTLHFCFLFGRHDDDRDTFPSRVLLKPPE